MKLINKLITTTIMSLSLSSAVFAASSVDSRVSDLEKQMKEIRSKNAMGDYGVTTAPCRADVNGYGVYITLGTIYAHPKVGGTEFAYSDNDPAGSVPISGRVKDMDFDWDWGVRVALGADFAYDNWDANLNYTYFNGDGSRSVNGGLNGSVVPLKGSGQITNGCGGFDAYTVANVAKSQFDSTFHILNLELGRSYFISGKLAMRPHVGLQSSWIDLNQLTRYSGGVDLGINTVSVKDDSEFWGMGPRLGFDSKWFLASGFLVFGNLSGSLLYGIFDVDHNEKFSACSTTNRVSLSANVHKFVPTVQGQLGIGYNKFFNENKQHIYIRVGYEVQYYWRANQMVNIDNSANFKYQRVSEDVALQGVVIDLTITF